MLTKKLSNIVKKSQIHNSLIKKTGIRTIFSSKSSSNTNDVVRKLDSSNKSNFGIQIVPYQEVRVVETFGKYSKTLNAGIHLVIPIVQKIRYSHSLKERMLPVDPQTCWTQDNVQVSINGNVFVKVSDPFNASYNCEEPYSMIYQMAFSAMRAEVGLMELDDLLNQREHINEQITKAIRPRIIDWGIDLLGYEIQDIEPQREVLEDLTKQSKAERDRREAVKASEGERQVRINHAEGAKQAEILKSEGSMQATLNNATAEAEARIKLANAEAEAINMTGIALADEESGGPEAAKYNIAQKMAESWSNMAKNSPTILLPNEPNNVSSLVSQALATYNSIKKP
jgi:regulator of protease activity HflC (stomatin/prohibitin superfamily)